MNKPTMRRARKDFGMLTVSALALSAAAHAQTVEAEVAAQQVTDAETTSSGIDEIVVTAQRRAASLQDSALAISAFAGEDLADRGIDSVADLQSYIPNLHFGEEQGNTKISLRGIGLQGTSSISDSGVAFYIDNFYIGRPSGGSALFHDIERIEVLRGPQGTLYGRNATGGVVNVITKRPEDVFEGSVGATYGSRDLFETRGVVNVPLAEDVAVRVSGVYQEQNGYVENTSDSATANDFFGSPGDISIRGQFLAGTPETIEVLLQGTYSDVESTGIAQQFLERNIGGPPPTRALLATIPDEDPDPLVSSNDGINSNKIETHRFNAQLSKSFDGVDAILQVGKQWLTTELFQDFDGSDVDVSQFTKTEDGESESIEFRLSSNNDSDLSWIVGGYYFAEDNFIFRRVQLNGLTPGGVINLPDFLLDEIGNSETIAAFGSATYSFSPVFRFTGGLRYTEDEKFGSKTTRGNFGAPFPPDIPNDTFDGDVAFDKVTWKAQVEYDATDDVLVYAGVSNGYKAGGFNITSNGLPYEPEDIIAYEAGVKSDLFDRRVRFNADAFYYDYQDLQLTTLTTVNNAPGQLTTNAANSTLYGIEIESQFAVTDDLTLSAGYAYISAEFDEYLNADPRAPETVANPLDPLGLDRPNLAGNTIPYVANNTVTLGAQYETSLGQYGELIASGNFQWHDDFFLREYNDADIDRVDSNSKTDLSLTWAVAESGLRLTGFVNNLEDNVEKNNIYISPGFIGLSATTAYTRPRTIGLRADYAF